MADYIKKQGDTEKFKGKLIQVVARNFEISKNDKIGHFTIEMAKRPPGVRIFIIKDNQILLTKEFRSELEDWDYRVPGGKIFDSLDDCLAHTDNDKLLTEKSIVAVADEALHEAGVIVKDQKLLTVSKAGATIEWDLHYYLVTDFEMAPQGNKTEATEIIHPEWFTLEEAKKMCLCGDIKEDRTVGILLKYILNNS